MASIIRQYPDAISADLEGTAMDNLAAGAGALCTAFDNAAAGERWTRCYVELVIDFAVAPTAGSIVDVYFLPALDGTNYPDADVTSCTSNPSVQLVVASTTNAQRLTGLVPILPPCLVKPYVVNRANQALSATGHSLKILPATDEVAAA